MKLIYLKKAIATQVFRTPSLYLCLRKLKTRTDMKLAEALSLRADLQKRVSLLKLRMKNSAKVQEGDKPAENMEELFNKLEGMLAQLEGLIYRINDTNMHTLCEGESLTRMMARKDVLSIRVALMRELLKHVTENDTRFGKNELKYI